jgi:xanthine dehydrogenase accessory factor
MNNIYLQLLDNLQKNSSLVIATVTKSIGSTPQKPGSSALFNLKGLVYGTVGGGVLEGEVQKIAQKAIVSKESGYYNFKLNNEIGSGAGAICGGQASILVDAAPSDHRIVFEQIRQSLKNRIPGILVTMVSGFDHNKIKIQRFWSTENEKNTIPHDHNRKISIEVQRLLSGGTHSEYEEMNIPLPEEDHNALFLLEPIFPPPHLVIAGAGHIGKALTHIGKLLDFEVTVIDDRVEYANNTNLPDADHIIVNDIGEAVGALKIAHDTYIVIVTRGHNDDTKALRECIGSGAAYVGMIGSKNKVALMRKEFIQHGWAEPNEWKDIHAPIGLDIEAKSVQEIAISIAAQLIQVKNSKIPAYV